MKKHITVLIAVLLTLVITLGCVFTVRLLRISDNYLNRLEISYRGALGELSDNLEKTSLALKKMRYSSGELLRHKGTDTVISSCSAAASGAAALPFSEENSAVISHIFEVAAKLGKELSLDNGYRIVNNCGEDGGQTVKHLHFHLMGGRQFTWPAG